MLLLREALQENKYEEINFFILNASEIQKEYIKINKKKKPELDEEEYNNKLQIIMASHLDKIMPPAVKY